MVVPLPEKLRTGTDSSSDLENINTNNRYVYQLIDLVKWVFSIFISELIY